MSARILIVDDTLPSVKMLSAKLSGEYFDVITATDGLSALEMVNEHNPDLVLLDVMMPGMDGYEVCERIKGNPETAHIPVVMVTALSESEEKVRGLDAGADDFLTKPVSDMTLFARVNSLVRLKQMMDQWRLREETTKMLGFPAEDEAEPIKGAGNARVVLIDESAIESENVKSILSRDHDEVVVINGFEGAQNAVAGADAEVVVIGSGAAGMDRPLRLCSQIRAREETRLLPILLLGDEEDMDQLVKALDIGVNDYVVRPMDENELLARVRTQVRRKRYQDRLHANFLKNLSLALVDSLTGLHNRRYLTTHLEAIMKRMAKDDKPVSLLMIDIDHFKGVNDTHGHAAGDRVLAEIAQKIALNVRGFDLAARYGGEEFVVVMPDTTLDVALEVAERLCLSIGGEPIETDGAAEGIEVTVSIGVSAISDGNYDPLILVDDADKELYKAKNEGRNRVSPKS